MTDLVRPTQDLATLAEWGTEHLEQVIAIDSPSDESSDAIPSSEGQRRLSQHLAAFFGELGYDSVLDDNANLIVTVPARLPAGAAPRPTLALMAHLDTAEGTEAVGQLFRVPAWDGSRIEYPDNDRLTVAADRYDALAPFVGEDVLHGPGSAPVGLDDKLGMSEIMTLARILATNPDIPHGELKLVFRPDEEIGRMAAVEGLARTLASQGVKVGYTIDGLAPFEINVDNFNASRAVVTAPAADAGLAPARRAKTLRVAITGVKSHGATAKAEGYLNAVVVLTRAMARIAGDAVVPVWMRTDPTAETNAEVRFVVRGDSDEALAVGREALQEALRAELEPAAWRGAGFEIIGESEAAVDQTPGALARIVAHLQRLLDSDGPEPLLSEDSEGWEGYTNPHAIRPADDGGVELLYRIRDFDPDTLEARQQHLVALARDAGLNIRLTAQYVNMGPTLANHPELVEWAEAALPEEAADRASGRQPIRGGTGVDPFLEQGIPVGNLGTGYFAPESEKELTSRQNIARHALWLARLVQVAGAA